jgi:uncharacterized protein YqeY
MLLEKIRADSLVARKQKEVSAAFLVTLLSEAQNIGKNKGNRETTDEEVIALVKKFKLNSQELLKALVEQGRAFSYAYIAAEQEIEYLDSLLPKQLSEQELTAILQDIIKEIGNDKKNMGKVMAKLKEEYFGKYDGAQASALVKKLLN